MVESGPTEHIPNALGVPAAADESLVEHRDEVSMLLLERVVAALAIAAAALMALAR